MKKFLDNLAVSILGLMLSAAVGCFALVVWHLPYFGITVFVLGTIGWAITRVQNIP